MRADKTMLETKLKDLANQKLLAEKEYSNNKIQTREFLINATFEQSKSLIKEAINKFDDPILLNCKSGAEYLLALLNPLSSSFENLKSKYELYDQNPENGKKKKKHIF